MSSELFVPASAGPTTVLPASVDDALPELTTLQERYDHGYQKGFMAGYAEGVRQAQAERAADLANHKAACAAAQARASSLLGHLAAAADEQLARLAGQSAALTEELVEAALGAELRCRPERALEAARQALAGLPPEPAVVRVNPQDEPLLRGGLHSEPAPATAPAQPGLHPSATARSGQAVTVVADPGVEPGGCIVTVGATTIDARVGQALARAREAFYRASAEDDVLGGTPEEHSGGTPEEQR